VDKIKFINVNHKLIKMYLAIICMCVSYHTYAQEHLNSQLPLACTEYVYAASEKHQACFPGAVSNAQKGTASGHRNYAIKQFYALNWPLKKNVRGIPDYKAELGHYKDNVSVWQSWKTIDDINNLNVESPNDWENTDPFIPQECIAEFDKIKVWPLVLFQNKTPGGFELFDKNNLSVYYQTYFNKQAFDTILKSEIYKGIIKNIVFPSGKKLNGEPEKRGAIIIKAAWKELAPFEYLKYHKSQALIKDSSGNCKLGMVGLVGIHIVSKVNDNKVNPWSWATFEHIDNAPSVGEILANGHARKQWTFLSASEVALDNCSINKQWDFDLPGCRFNKPKTKGSDNPPNIIRVPITNHVIKREVKEDNRSAQEKLDNTMKNSIWKNYKLIDVQWLDKFNQPRPELLSNTILEPFTQKSSCIQCHGDAKNTDFVFSLKNIQINKGE